MPRIAIRSVFPSLLLTSTLASTATYASTDTLTSAIKKNAIKPIAVNSHHAIKQHPEQTEDEAGSNDGNASGSATGAGAAPVPDKNTRILVAYTPAAAAKLSDMQAYVDGLIADTNESFSNSGLSLGVELAHLQAVTHIENVNFTENLRLVMNDNDGVMDELHQLRLDHEADLVFLVMDQNSYCGKAGTIRTDYAHGFAVLHWGCGSHTFMHELGHLHGALHDLAADPSTSPYAYGHAYKNEDFRTIMATKCGEGENACPPIRYWSNPDISFTHNNSGRTEIIGNADTEDNHRVLQETGYRIANLHEHRLFGDEEWFFDAGGRVYATPLQDDEGTLYFGSHDTNFYAVNADGSLKWSTPVGNPITGSAALSNGILYFQTYGIGTQHLYALDSSNGEIIWALPKSGSTGGTPAIGANGEIYIMEGSYLEAIDTDGQKMWTFSYQRSVGSNNHSASVGEDGTIYIGGGTNFHALNPIDGSKEWSVNVGSTISGQAAIGANGNLFFASSDGQVHAVTPDGTLLWSADTGGTIHHNNPVIDSQGNIIIGNNAGLLTSLNPENGSTNWEPHDLGAYIDTTAAITDKDEILILSAGYLNLIDSQGRILIRKSYVTTNGASSIVIGADDTFYYGYGDMSGGLFARKSGLNLTAGETPWPVKYNNSNHTGRITAPAPVNTAPSISILSPTDLASLLTTANPVTLSADAQDNEDGDLSASVEWYSTIDGTITSPATFSEGTHTLTATVTDSGGLQSSASHTVTVSEPANNHPSINVLSPTNGAEFTYNQNPITLSASADDSEDGDLSGQVSWQSNLDGTVTSPAQLSIGTHQLTASVTDSAGASISAAVSVTINPTPNTAPTVSFLAPANAAVINEDNNPINFSLSASDNEDGDLTSQITLSSNIDGVIGTSASLSVGVHTITASITDSGGLSASAELTLNIEAHINLPPTIEITTTDNTTITEGDSLILSANASDPEEGDLTASIQWHSDVDGNITSPAILTAGTHLITAEVFDQQGLSASSTISVDVQAQPTTGLVSNVVSGVTNTEWTTVVLDHVYDSMVVVATPVTVSGAAPVVVRIRNAGAQQFEMRLQRTDGSNSAVTPLNVHYLAVEEGVYTEAEHGITMEAVKTTSSVTDRKYSWNGQSKSYANSYSQPVVLGQVMTYNDTSFSQFWTRGLSRLEVPNSSYFHVGKHVGEDSNKTRADETLGYIVVETGHGSVDGLKYTAGVGSDIVRGVDNGSYGYSFSGLSAPTSAVVTQAGMDGGDGGWAVLSGSNPVSGDRITISIDEDRFRDNERRHTTEQAAFIVFESEQ